MIPNAQPPDAALIGTGSDAAEQPGVRLHEALCQNDMEGIQVDIQTCCLQALDTAACNHWMIPNIQIKLLVIR